MRTSEPGDVNLGEMAVFARTVRAGSFSAAARELKLTPSAVSKKVSRLEDRYPGRYRGGRTARQPAPVPPWEY